VIVFSVIDLSLTADIRGLKSTPSSSRNHFVAASVSGPAGLVGDFTPPEAWRFLEAALRSVGMNVLVSIACGGGVPGRFCGNGGGGVCGVGLSAIVTVKHRKS